MTVLMANYCIKLIGPSSGEIVDLFHVEINLKSDKDQSTLKVHRHQKQGSKVLSSFSHRSTRVENPLNYNVESQN